ncbi:MAG: hypothetical protein GY737_21240 [Desulfobacteraceae bacterium]|nr:hypothetical protein [Desulfobacteraceae bacterium]
MMKKQFFSVALMVMAILIGFGQTAMANSVYVDDGYALYANGELQLFKVAESNELEPVDVVFEITDATEVTVSDGKAFVTTLLGELKLVDVSAYFDIETPDQDDDSDSQASGQTPSSQLDLINGVLTITALEPVSGNSYSITMKRRGNSSNWALLSFKKSAEEQPVIDNGNDDDDDDDDEDDDYSSGQTN